MFHLGLKLKICFSEVLNMYREPFSMSLVNNWIWLSLEAAWHPWKMSETKCSHRNMRNY